jgi:hypothetical protein
MPMASIYTYRIKHEIKNNYLVEVACRILTILVPGRPLVGYLRMYSALSV